MHLNKREVNLHCGALLWPKLAETPRKYPALKADKSCDALVIGGGITGALVCRELLRAGVGTMVIDQGAIGNASTSASTAMVSYDFDETLTSLAKRHSESMATRCYELSFEAVKELRKLIGSLEKQKDFDTKVALRIDGTGSLAASFEAEFSLRERKGLRVQLLDREELLRRFGIRGARALVATDAAQINSLQFTRDLFERLQGQGLEIYERSQAQTLEESNDGVTVRLRNGAKITCKRVIFATGYASEKYLEQRLGILTTDFCFATAGLNDIDSLEKCHFVEQKRDYLYASTFRDRIIVGVQDGRYYFPRERELALERKAAAALERAKEFMPSLELKIDRMWAGTFAKSKDSLPYLLQPATSPKSIFVLGYGGNGIASSAMLAPMVVDLFKGKRNTDIRLFSADR